MLRSMREGQRFPPKIFRREDLLSRLPRLRGLFSQEGVTAAYLFGSVLNGKAQPGSDLDIAIQGEQEYEWSELYGRVYKGLCELLHPDSIALVILNEVSSSLRIRAQREGFPLYAQKRDGVFLPELASPAEESLPLKEASPWAVLSELLQGLRGEMAGDPQFLRLAP